MQLPKLFYTLCATVICGGILTAQADDNAAQAAARAAVLQKMQEMNGATDTNAPAPAPVETAPPVAVPVEPAVVAPVAPVAPVAAVTPAPATEPTSTTGDNPAQAAARAALIQKIGAAPTPAASAPAPVGTPASLPPPPFEYHPIVGPALPISTDQQTRLQTLDAKYYANQISPLDYFTQREAILKGQ